MSIAHGAQFASCAVPTHSSEGIGEPIAESGEPIGESISDTLARLADRLAVVAVAAHVMERRYPSDVYARSIARASGELARDMRETVQRARDGAAWRAPRIVDATPDAPPASVGVTHQNAPRSTARAHQPASSTHATGATARKRRETPPAAPSASQASDSVAHPHTHAAPSGEPVRPSGDVSGVKGRRHE